MLAAPRRLGAQARRALQRVEAGRGEAWVPAAALAELLILRELGRVTIGLPEIKHAMDAAAGLHFLPLDLHQLDQFAALTAIRDPFDRLIVSAARSLQAVLITRDAGLVESGLVDTIWA